MHPHVSESKDPAFDENGNKEYSETNLILLCKCVSWTSTSESFPELDLQSYQPLRLNILSGWHKIIREL